MALSLQKTSSVSVVLLMYYVVNIDCRYERCVNRAENLMRDARKDVQIIESKFDINLDLDNAILDDGFERGMRTVFMCDIINATVSFYITTVMPYLTNMTDIQTEVGSLHILLDQLTKHVRYCKCKPMVTMERLLTRWNTIPVNTRLEVAVGELGLLLNGIERFITKHKKNTSKNKHK